MRTTIKATHMPHTNAIDAYVHTKIELLERVLAPEEKSHIARIDVGRGTTHHKSGKDAFYAEITLHVRKKDFRVTVKAPDLYIAIDGMIEKIVKEVTRHHKAVDVQMKRGARQAKAQLRGV
jgi:ribosomal subunit interface protein